MLAYAGKTGKGIRESEREKERRHRERGKEREREREDETAVVGGCYYLFDSGILRAGWIYLDIPAERSICSWFDVSSPRTRALSFALLRH